MTDGTGTTTYSYDATAGTGTLTYPNGHQVTGTYNQAGQLVQVSDWLGHTITFKYAPGGALNQENFPGGVQVTDDEAKTGDDLEVTRNGTTLASFTDDRDSGGQLSTVATTGSPGSVSYGYTVAGRLSSADQQQLDYDGQGDLTTPPGGTAQQFNAAGELEPGNGASYAYNKEGDLTGADLSGRPPQQLSCNQAGELRLPDRVCHRPLQLRWRRAARVQDRQRRRHQLHLGPVPGQPRTARGGTDVVHLRTRRAAG